MNTTSRRNFIKGASLLSGGLAAFGLSLSPHGLLSSDHRSDLPYYMPGAPFASDLRKESGELLNLRGTIYAPDGKTPLQDALVEIWHCNAQGQFDFSRHFAYRGKTKTDANGIYGFKTHFPGKHTEGGNPKMSRIFVLVQVKGYKEAFSQLYFDHKQNPYIDSKHWQSSPLAEMPTLPQLTASRSGKIIVYNHYMNRSTSLNPMNSQEIAVRQLRLYPTHAVEEAFLTVDQSKTGNVLIKLLNQQQETVYKQLCTGVPSGPLKIDVGHLPSGKYSCLIYTSKMGSYTKVLRIV